MRGTPKIEQVWKFGFRLVLLDMRPVSDNFLDLAPSQLIFEPVLPIGFAKSASDDSVPPEQPRTFSVDNLHVPVSELRKLPRFRVGCRHLPIIAGRLDQQSCQRCHL